jgi:hypothetical protein
LTTSEFGASDASSNKVGIAGADLFLVGEVVKGALFVGSRDFPHGETTGVAQSQSKRAKGKGKGTAMKKVWCFCSVQTSNSKFP